MEYGISARPKLWTRNMAYHGGLLNHDSLPFSHYVKPRKKLFAFCKRNHIEGSLVYKVSSFGEAFRIKDPKGNSCPYCEAALFWSRNYSRPCEIFDNECQKRAIIEAPRVLSRWEIKTREADLKLKTMQFAAEKEEIDKRDAERSRANREYIERIRREHAEMLALTKEARFNRLLECTHKDDLKLLKPLTKPVCFECFCAYRIGETFSKNWWRNIKDWNGK